MGERSGWGRAVAAALALIGAVIGVPGCGFVPRTRLDDATRLVHGLRTENTQLKDSNLKLKVENQELSQRAVDDAQALRGLEMANAQYERSIQGYQEDRDRLRSAFNDLKDQVRAAPVDR